MLILGIKKIKNKIHTFYFSSFSDLKVLHSPKYEPAVNLGFHNLSPLNVIL